MENTIKSMHAKHNPWANFTNVSKKANQPLEKFPTNFSKLPTVSFIIPNLQNDCTMEQLNKEISSKKNKLMLMSNGLKRIIVC